MINVDTEAVFAKLFKRKSNKTIASQTDKEYRKDNLFKVRLCQSYKPVKM